MLFKNRDSVRSGVELTSNNTGRDSVSRRKFIRATAAGAAGAAFVFGRAGNALAKNIEEGEITLDALLITYFGAPIGAEGSSFWALRGSYANTLHLKSVDLPDLPLKAKVATRKQVFMGHAITQNPSGQVAGGIILRHKGLDGTATGFATTGVALREETRFYAILKPRLEVFGSPRSLRYRFVDGLAETHIAIRSFQPEKWNISQETFDSWLKNYRTDRATLTRPRYRFVTSTGLVDAGSEHNFTLTEDGERRFSRSKQATTTARIVEQSGFRSEEIKQAFAVGKDIEITHTSLQEHDADEIIEFKTTFARGTRGINEIYWDSVFKNFLIIDAGE